MDTLSLSSNVPGLSIGILVGMLLIAHHVVTFCNEVCHLGPLFISKACGLINVEE